MTRYVVLSVGAGLWKEVKRVEAHASDEAVRKAVPEPESGSTYVAVPERSFVPMTFQVETKTTVKLAAAKTGEPVASRKAPEPEAEEAEADVVPAAV